MFPYMKLEKDALDIPDITKISIFLYTVLYFNVLLTKIYFEFDLLRSSQPGWSETHPDQKQGNHLFYS